MVTQRTSWLVVLATSIVAGLGCPSNQTAPEPATSGPTDAPKKGFRFGWRAGDVFELVYTKQLSGESIEVRTRGTIKADGDKLVIAFDPVKLSDKEKKLAAPNGTHPFIDVWPTLVVDKKHGELVSIEGDVPAAAKEVVTRRWNVWTGYLALDVEVGTERSYQAEVEAGEGLLVPVKVTERYSDSPELGHKLDITRAYEGDQTRQLWQVMLAERGASKAAVDAVKQASREEKIMIQTDPATMHNRRIEETSTYAVTTSGKGGESVDIYTERETWVFLWTR